MNSNNWQSDKSQKFDWSKTFLLPNKFLSDLDSRIEIEMMLPKT